MDVRIDRDCAVPARQQLRAVVVRAIAAGDLGAGAPLPSVRDLADRAGIAPMTVTRVYADLKSTGLIEARAGAGTFVAVSPLSRLGKAGAGAGIWAAIDTLIDDGTARGIGLADLLSLVAARARRPRGGPRVVMVGLFADATRSYADRVAAQAGVPVSSLALHDEALDDDGLAARLGGADLILTFGNLEDRIAALVPGCEVVPLHFIPAESTRLALARLDPLADVVAVSRFADFLPVLTLGVRRFASHVRRITVRAMDAEDLAAVLARADVVVMSTGGDRAADLAPEGAIRIEYRHVPDPGDIDRLVLPRLDRAGSAHPPRKEAS